MTATSPTGAQEPSIGPSALPETPAPPVTGRRMRFLTPIIGITAVVALGLGVAGLVADNPSSLRSQVKHLQAEVTRASTSITALRGQLSTANGQISSLETTSQAGTISTLQGDVQSLQGKVALFTTCIPQLSTEINGLGINWQINPVSSQDSFSITNPTIVSSDCSKTLYGG